MGELESDFFIRTIDEMTDEEIIAYDNEFKDPGESCSVLMSLRCTERNHWRDGDILERHNAIIGFYCNDELCDMARITRTPSHVEYGQIEYSIRPSKRSLGFAKIFLQLISEFCKELCIYHPTACVDVTNIRSLKAFEKADFVPTGIEYDWSGDRKAIELVKKCHETERRT